MKMVGTGGLWRTAGTAIGAFALVLTLAPPYAYGANYKTVLPRGYGAPSNAVMVLLVDNVARAFLDWRNNPEGDAFNVYRFYNNKAFSIGYVAENSAGQWEAYCQDHGSHGRVPQKVGETQDIMLNAAAELWIHYTMNHARDKGDSVPVPN